MSNTQDSHEPILTRIDSICKNNYFSYENEMYKNMIFSNEDYYRSSYDGEIKQGPCIYEKCNFGRVDFLQAFIARHIFIDCDMSHMEATGAVFENCIFINCDFRHSNFTNARFKGCLFSDILNCGSNESCFEKAGLNRTFWESYDGQPTVISNVIFKGVSFRGGKFSNVIFKNITNSSASFEDTKLVDCSIDNFNLEHSSCKGMFIKNCHFDNFIISFPKIPSVIGLYGALENSKVFNIVSTNSKNGEVYSIGTISIEMLKILQNSAENAFKANKLFEFINLSYMARQVFLKLKTDLQNNLPVGHDENISNKSFYKTILVNFYKNITNKGIEILAHDFEATCRLVLYYQINDFGFFKILLQIFANSLNIANSEPEQYAYTRVILEEIARSTSVENRYIVTIINKNANIGSNADRQNFELFYNTLMSLANINDENGDDFVSFSQGSIVSERLSDKTKMFSIFLIAIFLGGEMRVENGDFSVNFNGDKLTKNICTINSSFESEVEKILDKAEKILKLRAREAGINIDDPELTQISSTIKSKLNNQKNAVEATFEYIQDNHICMNSSPANALNYLYGSRKAFGFQTISSVGKNGLLITA